MTLEDGKPSRVQSIHTGTGPARSFKEQYVLLGTGHTSDQVRSANRASSAQLPGPSESARVNSALAVMPIGSPHLVLVRFVTPSVALQVNRTSIPKQNFTMVLPRPTSLRGFAPARLLRSAAPRTANRAIARRGYASHGGHDSAPSSDMPWYARQLTNTNPN